MRKFLILILFNIIHFKLGSQDLLFPINPGSQNYLSGNLGELRSDHFHLGLDIKTYGRINKSLLWDQINVKIFTRINFTLLFCDRGKY